MPYGAAGHDAALCHKIVLWSDKNYKLYQVPRFLV